MNVPDKLILLAEKLERVAAAWAMVNSQMQKAIAEIREDLEAIRAEE